MATRGVRLRATVALPPNPDTLSGYSCVHGSPSSAHPGALLTSWNNPLTVTPTETSNADGVTAAAWAQAADSKAIAPHTANPTRRQRFLVYIGPAFLQGSCAGHRRQVVNSPEQPLKIRTAPSPHGSRLAGPVCGGAI